MEVSDIRPGLPGGPPYVDRQALLAYALSQIAAMSISGQARAIDAQRWGLPLRPPA